MAADERSKRVLPSSKVLGAVIEEYIMTALPVGSRTIALKYSLGVSAATVRAVMAEMEEAGLLSQPHTSAGRVPTEAGFKVYVKCLLNPEGGISPVAPTEAHKDILKGGCTAARLNHAGTGDAGISSGRSAEALLHDTAKNLSLLTSCAGVMFVSRKVNFVIKNIKFVAMDSNGLIAALVSRTGAVQTKFIRLALEPAALDRINNYLNSIAGGLTLTELRDRIASEMRDEKNLYDELMSRALSLGALALEKIEGDEPDAKDGLYLEGMARVFEQPEFAGDAEKMRGLFAAFQEKSLLIKILDKGMEDGGLAPLGGAHVYFGSECDVKEFEGLGFVTAAYGQAPSSGDALGVNPPFGTLGVVGPIRMDYSKIIPLVGYTAGLLGGVLGDAGFCWG
ncbi:MAG: heat-inducible transcriptional repressor HrcA [Deltaproteobacteria bacterium]|nr:heat-inducible transcriptional repressor HrcA [Deltaproteobacteria bacterium]